MDLTESPAERAFRLELRAWLEANPPGPEPEALEDWVSYGKAWQRKLYDAGWCGVHWPREYGGRGASLVEQVIFEEEMARARAPLLINLAGLTMGGPVLIAHGTEEQKRRFLRPILTAEEIWCQGFSEPDAGSDLPSLRTGGEVRGSEIVVTGQKVWTSFARYADWCMALVRTDPTAPRHHGISFLLVDMHAAGVTVRPLRQINGDEDFNEIFFEEVRVPIRNVVGALNEGWRIAITTLMYERQTLTFARQLQSRVALNDFAARVRSGSLPAVSAADPLLRQRIAASFVEAHAMRCLSLRHLTRVMRGSPPGPEGSMEKLFWSEMYQRILETALSALGPFGQAWKGDPRAPDNGRWPHLYLYSRGRTIAAGTSEIQRNTIAERVLRLPRHRPAPHAGPGRNA